ncbi:MAG: ABC transporter ATP-binding protein [Leucobacter sp.]
MKNLSFDYRSGVTVFSGLDASFERGELVGLCGPSGRGKSTLLYVLGLMLRPTKGRVLFRGADLYENSDAVRSRTRAESYGFVFQDAALDQSRTVLDNVTEPVLYRGADPRQAYPRARSLLRQFGVEARAEHKPGQISGGQAGRIALCRALLGDPPVILADEPTGNLDVESARVVIDALRDRARHGALVIVATHDPSVMTACDRLVTL